MEDTRASARNTDVGQLYIFEMEEKDAVVKKIVIIVTYNYNNDWHRYCIR